MDIKKLYEIILEDKHVQEQLADQTSAEGVVKSIMCIARDHDLDLKRDDVESVVHSVEVEGEELDEETLNQVAGGAPSVQPVVRITQFVAMEDHRLDPRIELSKGVRLPGQAPPRRSLPACERRAIARGAQQDDVTAKWIVVFPS